MRRTTCGPDHSGATGTILRSMSLSSPKSSQDGNMELRTGRSTSTTFTSAWTKIKIRTKINHQSHLQSREAISGGWTWRRTRRGLRIWNLDRTTCEAAPSSRAARSSTRMAEKAACSSSARSLTRRARCRRSYLKNEEKEKTSRQIN